MLTLVQTIAGMPRTGASLERLEPCEGKLSRTVLSLDGSSNYVRDADWLKDAQCTTRNRLWCYPDTKDGGDRVYGHVLWNWSF